MNVVAERSRRSLITLLAFVLVLGSISLMATQQAQAAYPGGNGWIVFMDGFELYAMPSDGSAAPTNLTNSPVSSEADPVFSPDGTQIAFSRDQSGVARIWIADFDPSGPSLSDSGTWTQVSSGSTDGEPSWSPDGTTIAYNRGISWQPSAGTATAEDVTGLVLTDGVADFVAEGVVVGMTVTNVADGSTGTVLTIDSVNQITLSAALAGGTDNQWNIGDTYTIGGTYAQIFKAPADGSSPAGTQLSAGGTTPTYSDRYPAWSPTANIIAFTTTRNGNSDVYRFSSVDGSGEVNLTTGGSFGNHASRPSWSPDGTTVAFQLSGSDSNIWTVNSTTFATQQITGPGNTGTDNDREPAWSPDGTQIAFRRGDTGGDKTFVTASDGSGAATQIGSATSPATHVESDWQPALIGAADGYSVDEGATVNIAAAGVLSNDETLTASVGTVTAVLVGDVSNGTLTLNADGSFGYTHDGSETLSDSFTYRPVQGSVQGSVATVSLTINPLDDDPTAVADGPYGVTNGGLLTTTAPGVLGNDSDPEGLALTAVLVSDVSNGTLTLNANGSFTYTHDGSATFSDSFTYQAQDPGGNLSGVVTVSIDIAASPISVSVDGPSFGAPGVTATFNSAVSGGAGIVTYAWSVERFGAEVATGSGASLNFTPSLGGLHTVTVTATDDIGSDSTEVNFTVLGDIGNSQFVGNILWLAEAGITKGCNPPANDEFCPDDPVTRGAMAAFLVRFLGLTDDGGGNTFTDDDNSIFEADIAKLAAAGITKGCNPPTNDNFCPNDSVTRGQMAAFLVRALSLTDDGGGNTFTDDDGSVFETDIAKLAAAGITKGCNPPTNDNFCPNDSVTRGQMAAFLNRAGDL
ncbi:endo-1,4-beta-xylanase A precursor [bacterium BMS3Bbin02]|nr:endo-1,4-beta-xylanase A precursor [bacterium BMS3Bbin02]